MTHTMEHQLHPRDQTLTTWATSGLFYNCCEIKADGNEPLVNYLPAKTTTFVTPLKNFLPKGGCRQTFTCIVDTEANKEVEEINRSMQLFVTVKQNTF